MLHFMHFEDRSAFASAGDIVVNPTTQAYDVSSEVKMSHYEWSYAGAQMSLTSSSAYEPTPGTAKDCSNSPGCL